MDDLNGLSWSDSNKPNKPPPMSSGYLFPTVPSNGGSGRSTPLSATSNRSASPAKPATSTGDSFANLVSFNSSGGNKNLSLMEQQKRLEEEKAKKEAANRNRFESQYGGQNNQFWDNFEQGRTQSPANIPAPRSVPPPDDEDDILGAFNADAPVDASTHFPVPASARASPAIATNSRPEPPSGGISMQDNTGGLDAFDDDDPFGLNQLKPKSAPAPAPQQVDDDDFLGLLGKPVSEIPRQPSPKPASVGSSDRDREQDPSPMPSSEIDRAIAELVDMGFPADKSRTALKTTQSGTDVQGAVGWLLTQAHAESHQKTHGRSSAQPTDRSGRNDSRNRDRPSWMREERNGSQSRDDRRSPASAEKDPAQMAAQIGSSFFKQANSLWKSGSKKFQQAVNEFNTEQDPNQPRWMKEGAPQHDDVPPPQPQRPGRREQPAQSQAQQDFTNEALLLESGDGRPRKPTRPRESQQTDPRVETRDQQSPGPAPPKQQGNFLERPSRPSSQDPRSRVSRFAAEEQQAQAYVSPARRKRPQAPAPAPEPAVDLFDSPAPVASRPKPSAPARTTTPQARSASIPVRPKAPTRSIPPVSQQALQSTHRHRGKAAESYKRGDYAEAHQSFSTALGMLPEKHPITIIIRSNRAMTALKIGEPKSAVDDADIILTFIGPSKGESEVIDLSNGEAPKPMKDFYGKALMRKAEALEQLERWNDAAQAWKDAVESGHGGSTSIQGRNRCEKAAGTSKPQQPAPRKRPTPTPKASALSDLTPTSVSGSDFESVSRLRQANQAAERADEEKFALSESVDARIATWRNGKQDNLRALLGSLDSVLWPEAGWKKIGLSELVLPNKVKIQYMKGIGKVHPDKISTTATTEQRMIAGSVFGTLNEAWDKFRVENNL